MYLKCFKRIFIILVLFISCTENPFFDDEISYSEKLEITGNVLIEGESDHSDVLIYMEGFDIFTKSDRNGNFKIKIDIAPALQPGGGVTAFYKIYFYVENYQYKSAMVFIKDGEFVYGSADLNLNGQLSEQIVLPKILDIKTEIRPETVKNTFNDSILIIVRLENVRDSVIVGSHFTKDDNFASAYLRQNESIYLLSSPSTFRKVLIDSIEFWEMKADLNANNFKVGSYEIIPFIKVFQEGLPNKIFTFYGRKSMQFTDEFLKLPYRRKNAQLKIINIPD